MASPFDIEEIFPDDGAGVRLPRRQAGNAPQGLAVTLLADYTLRTRAWVPSAAIVVLLAESGVSAAGARTAISRLARRGVLEGGRQGRTSSYRLTLPAVTNLSVGGGLIVSAPVGGTTWDGWWTLVASSLPQEERGLRRALRNQLRWLGYAPLYDGLWISPHGLTGMARAQVAQVGQSTLGAITVFRARHVELATAGGRAPIDAWDIPAIAAQYESFIRRWSELLPRMRAGRVTGAEAVRARTEVMDTYRRFPTLDPQLPLELLPPDWPRRPARELFAAVYDGLAEAAQEHVRAVVGRHGDHLRPDIRAHTVADLLAGLGDASCTAPPAR